MWGNSSILDYYFILPDETEEKFFQNYHMNVLDLDEDDEKDEAEDTQGSEVVRSDESIQIACKKVQIFISIFSLIFTRKVL